MRKERLELSRYCYRQPLKLVRLPVPPLPRGRARWRASYLVAGAVGGGVGAGAAGAGFDVAGGGADVPVTTDLVPPRCPSIDSVNANSMNNTAAIDVALVSSVAPERAPNAAWLLLPPNALAISPPRPCCRRMTSERRRQIRT